MKKLLKDLLVKKELRNTDQVTKEIVNASAYDPWDGEPK